MENKEIYCWYLILSRYVDEQTSQFEGIGGPFWSKEEMEVYSKEKCSFIHLAQAIEVPIRSQKIVSETKSDVQPPPYYFDNQTIVVNLLKEFLIILKQQAVINPVDEHLKSLIGKQVEVCWFDDQYEKAGTLKAFSNTAYLIDNRLLERANIAWIGEIV